MKIFLFAIAISTVFAQNDNQSLFGIDIPFEKPAQGSFDADLWLAVARNDPNATLQAISKGANKFSIKSGQSILEYSVSFRKDHFQVLEILLNDQTSIPFSSKQKDKALKSALHSITNFTKSISLLVKSGSGAKDAFLNQKNQTLMHLSAFYNKPQVARMALDSGCTLNKQDADLNTPLAIAVRQENLESVGFLIAVGANTEISNKFGKKPLQLLGDNFISLLKLLKRTVTFDNDTVKADSFYYWKIIEQMKLNLNIYSQFKPESPRVNKTATKVSKIVELADQIFQMIN